MEDQDRSPLVVIGASAGGVDALMTLVAALPAEFPAPIVVAQHLDPRRPSLLSELISARTSLHVVLVKGQELLNPGTIYVVPSSYDVEISDHHVGIVQNVAGASTPSVDRLMASAARVFGDNLTGVILTGIGADGAAGAQAIKAYGGTVIVQNPVTAQFSGMPSSVPPSVVDIVADLDAIGPLLVDLLGGRYALPPAGEDAELRLFLDRVREQSGIDFGAYKRPTIERRLQRRMAAVGTGSLIDYQRYLDRHPEELQRLVATFLVKVTRFFRDPELFTYLREHVLPQLIAEARERRELRLWSAGCSTGEEAYTLAMIVAELLGDELEELPIRIFATDVATEAVEFARRGIYPEAAVADVPPELIERYFLRLDGTYEIRKPVRGLVVFGEHDLGHRAPFPRIDLVLCRNVLIYFTPELQRRALQRFAFSLHPKGYLVLGKAESVSPLPAYFALEQPRLKIFRRNDESAPVVTDRNLNAALIGPVGARQNRRPPIHRLSPAQMPPPMGPTLAEQAVALLDALSLGVVTVDRQYDIRIINVAARRLLRIHGAGLGDDLVHRLPDQVAGSIRAAIDTAFRGEPSSVNARLAADIVDDRDRVLAISCDPTRADEAEAPIDAVRIEIADITSLRQTHDELDRERAALRGEVETLRARAAAAVIEVRGLRAANEAMAAEAGRLRAENEQLQLAHEEVQSAAEEIETLNEEQQATNEELETLNEELQATVEELNTANAELEARATELETLATTLDQRQRESGAERDQLDTILSTMSDAVLVIEPDRRVVRTNPAWDRWFGGNSEVIVADATGATLPLHAQLVARVALGESFTMTFTLLDDESQRRFEAIAQPVQGDTGLRWGIVVVRNITEREARTS